MRVSKQSSSGKDRERERERDRVFMFELWKTRTLNVWQRHS